MHMSPALTRLPFNISHFHNYQLIRPLSQQKVWQAMDGPAV